jgi:hypothetical protein
MIHALQAKPEAPRNLIQGLQKMIPRAHKVSQQQQEGR